MKRAFSLVELLVSLSILSIVIGLSFAVYQNIHSQATTVAQDSDQRSFMKAVDAFRSLGGNINSAILNNASLSEQEKIQALLGAVQSSALSSERVQRGAIGNVVGTDAVVVPYSAADNRTRIGISGGAVVTKTSGSGFVIVSSSNVAPASVPAVSAAAISAITAAKGSASGGARYASNQHYLWNEDTAASGSLAGGPTATSSAAVPPVSSSSKAKLLVAYRDAKGNAPGSISFNLDQYTNSSAIDMIIYRSDLNPLSLGDVSAVSGATFGGVALPAPTEGSLNVTGNQVLASGGNLVQGLVYSGVNLKDILAPTAWGASSQSLALSFAANKVGESRGIDPAGNLSTSFSVVANSIALVAPDIQIGLDAGTAGILDKNDKVVFDGIGGTAAANLPYAAYLTVTYTLPSSADPYTRGGFFNPINASGTVTQPLVLRNL